MSEQVHGCARRRRRHVFQILGYDPATPGAHYRRFVREMEIFTRTWHLQATVSHAQKTSTTLAWTIRARGPNWCECAAVELWPWDDIIRSLAKRRTLPRLVKAFDAYLEFLRTGALFRYISANVHYFLFAIVPPLQVVVLAVIAWGGAAAAVQAAGLAGWPGTAVAILASITGFLALLRLLANRLRLNQALDDWIVARDYIHGRDREIETRLDAFADVLLARVREGVAEEIVLLGHSLGATFAVDIAARALARDPDLGRHGTSISILTVGATIPKCALHPDAHRIRKQIARVANEGSIEWVEYQARGDPISFYRFHPGRLRRLRTDDEDINDKPLVRRVQIHDMLSSESFRRYRFRVMRRHYQFVMANEKPSSYDYFMMICGPVAFADWARSALGLLDYYGADGSLRTTDMKTSGQSS
jgi:hypothetical protein